MIKGKRVLAIVPARSGSRGLRHKNLLKLGGVTLIARAAQVLRHVSFIDEKILSTDSRVYAVEARRHGLATPFYRPKELATSKAAATDVVRHALIQAEAFYKTRFDVVLYIEPTSPLRQPSDIRETVNRLLSQKADAALTVSVLPTKSHPLKILTTRGAWIDFYDTQARRIANRQQLKGDFYWRNGLCYALTRACVLRRRGFINRRTVAVLTRRPVANIDDKMDFDWARFLLRYKAR